jgi:hypothetical protein
MRAYCARQATELNRQRRLTTQGYRGSRRRAGGCGCGPGDMMNVFAANDLEAADALALARLDDDGAPPASVPAGPVIAAVADGGQAGRAEHVCGRR